MVPWSSFKAGAVFILRLGRGPDDRRNADKYTAKASRLVALEAAAEAWSCGVPWNEALKLSEKAVKKVQDLVTPLGKPKAKSKAKAKPKAKGHAR